MDLLLSTGTIGAGIDQPDQLLFAMATVAIDLTLLSLGLLIRQGRAWLIALNVVAVASFLELRTATEQGLLFGGLDVIVLIVLLRQRWWFQWTPPEGDTV
jgi:hypothetical protein